MSLQSYLFLFTLKIKKAFEKYLDNKAKFKSNIINLIKYVKYLQYLAILNKKFIK